MNKESPFRMRLAVAALFLVLSLTASAEPFRFEPAASASTTSVKLIVSSAWRDSCVPRNAQVTRAQNVVDVLWSVPLDGACLAVVTPWSDEVPLGVLPAGLYEVRLRVNDFDGLKTIATRALVVSEGDGAFEIVPSFVSTAGGSVDLRSLDFCVASPQEVKSVKVDGVDVPYTVDPCSIVAHIPARAAGPVDVSVEVGTKVLTVRSTLRVLDPAATPDESVFERILIPVLYNGGGANGSQWRTELEMRNLSQKGSLRFFPNVMQPLAASVPTGPQKVVITHQSTKGVVLFIPRNIADDVRFGLLVRDVSRDQSAWGTEVPVVRERDSQLGDTPLMLANVPFDDRYRLTLRLYSIDGGPLTFDVFTAETPFVSRNVSIEPACETPPCNSVDPGFASVDLGALMPELAGRGARSIFIRPWTPARPHWAFVSVTNNTTQHVTTISPQ